MAVVFAAEPAGARSAAAAGLRRLHKGDLAGVRIVGPIPVFDRTLADLHANRVLAVDHPSALRYLIADAGGAITQAVEVVPTDSGGYRCAALTGAFAAGMDRALAAVEASAELAAADFELAAIRVRSLEVVALWFRSNNVGVKPDLFAIVPPAPAETPTGVQLDAAGFERTLYHVAADWAAKAALVGAR